MVSFVAHVGPVLVSFGGLLAYLLHLSRSNSNLSAVRRRVKGVGRISRTNENLSSKLVLIG